jgi:large subunit ribosomal protein L23
MNRERMMTILIGPVLSEKSTRVSEASNQVVFRVRPDAKKGEIREAVEKLFDVKVDSVQTMNVNGKTKRFRGVIGRRRDWKKAYVCLAEGSDIDFIGAD